MTNNTSQNTQSDIIVDDAIFHATRYLEREDKNQENQLEYWLTESALEKMQALSQALRTGTTQLPGWAISYANFVHKKLKNSDTTKPEIEPQNNWQTWRDEQLKHYHNELNAQKDLMNNSKTKHRYHRTLILTQDMAEKLEELGMTTTPGECIVLGFILMYHNLIETSTLPWNQPK